MGLFWQEMKKIWRPGMLAVLALLGAVFYEARIGIYCKYYPGGIDGQTDVLLAGQWVARYGPTLEDAEAEEIRTVELAQAAAEADAMVAQSGIGQKYGLTTLEDFRQMREQIYEQAKLDGGKVDTGEGSPYRDLMLLGNYLFGDDAMAAPWRVQEIEGMLRSFEYERERAQGDPGQTCARENLTRRELDRIAKANYGPDEAWRGLLPWEAQAAVSETMIGLVVWLVLSTMLLVSPPLVRDRACRMRAMQWSSRKGRGVLNTQLAAALCSALVWSALNLAAILALLLGQQGYGTLAACRIIGFQTHGDTAWWNLTYGGWCILMAVLALALALSAAALAFFLARYSAGYVAMLLKLIPLAVVLEELAWRAEGSAVTLDNLIYSAFRLPFAEVYAAAALLLLGLAACFAACLRQRGRELTAD